MFSKVFISILVLLIGCRVSDNSKIVHPTKENIKVAKANVINEKSGLNNIFDIEGLKNSVLKKEIGLDQENEEEIFGLISDVVSDELSRIYILDERQQLIQVFDEDGDFLTTLGGRGRGPNEFETARALTIYKDKWLIVSNGYRIDIYDIQKEEIEYFKSISIDYLAGDLCIINDHLFINKFQVLLLDGSSENPELIVSYDLPTFKRLTSFGIPYLSDNSMVVDRMSTGRVSCNEKSKVVLFTFDKMPIIHGYDFSTGELLWKSKIDNTSFLNVIETNQGGQTKLTYEQPESKIIDNVHSTITLNDNYEVFQIDRRLLNSDDYTNEQTILTYVLNSKTGIGRLINQNLPLFRYISSEKTYSVNKEYTSLKIFGISSKN